MSIRIASILLLLLLIAGCDRPPTGDASADPSPETGGSGDPVDDEAEVAWKDVVSGDGRWRVAWRPVGGPLPVSEPCVMDLRITDADGQPLDDRVEVIFDAEMPHHGHGMNVEPRVTREGNDWLIEGILLHMPGRWEASVDVELDGEIERTQWTLDIKR